MKKLILLTILNIALIPAIAQKDSLNNNVSQLKNILSLNYEGIYKFNNLRNNLYPNALDIKHYFQYLNLNYEYSFLQESAVFIGLTQDITYSKTYNLSLPQGINIGYRWYYNFNERVNKNKKTLNNAANFIHIGYSHQHYLFNSEPYNWYTAYNTSLHLQWGVRRNLSKNIFLEVTPSFNIYLHTKYYNAYPSINFKISRKILAY